MEPTTGKAKYYTLMEALKEQKFHILEEVKTVNIGNEMTVTLIGGLRFTEML